MSLPMGARLRLKATKDISTFPADVQKIFRAFKKYGLIVADNGSDMYVSGTYDTRWNNDVLNPAFGALKASDFEVVQLGWAPATSLVATAPATMLASVPSDLTVTAYDTSGNVATSYRGTVAFMSSDGAATLPASYTFTAADAGRHVFTSALTYRTAGAQLLTMTDTASPTITGSRATTVVTTLPPSIPQSTTFACFHYATRAAADAHLLRVNYDATLVATAYSDYPWVVIERWTCGGCIQSPLPLFFATPKDPNVAPGTSDRVAVGTDGTLLLVTRSTAGITSVQRQVSRSGGL